MTLEPQKIVELQISRNRQSQDAWDAFAGHRQHIQQILWRLLHAPTQAGASPEDPSRTLAVLGAGNCNDLDLSWLLDHFSLVQLVDLDRQAVEAGVARQGLSADPRVEIDAPRDISGLVSEGNAALPASQRFDVVLSSCVLSQIIEAANMQDAGGDAAEGTSRIQALRRHHLDQMLQRLVVGGFGILVTDFCSSLTWPELPHIPDEQLADAAMTQLQLRNFFTGLNPLVICQLLTDDVEFRRRVSDVRATRPWKWHLGQHKTFVVCGINFRRGVASHSGDR